jgi:putative transcription factor
MEVVPFIVMKNCEVCGRPTSNLTKISIEGAFLLVCDECRSLGEIVVEREKTKGGAPVPTGRFPRKSFLRPMVRQGSFPRKEDLEDISVVENYGALIKKARESLQLTPDELGRKIGEKGSVIRKLELERLIPDITLARKLEHALKIRLLVPSSETLQVEGLRKEGVEGAGSSLTLEDVAKVREKSRKKTIGESP